MAVSDGNKDNQTPQLGYAQVRTHGLTQNDEMQEDPDLIDLELTLFLIEMVGITAACKSQDFTLHSFQSKLHLET